MAGPACGCRPPPASRCRAGCRPTGWRIDPALAFAHARQESDFRPGAVSPAGAVGLMQVRPGTAGDFARARGTAVGELTYPPINLEYGQSFIELMRRNPGDPGPAAEDRRRLQCRAAAGRHAGTTSTIKGDPLLWIESLPYWETRYYVPAVLRNMWVYQQLEGLAAAEPQRAGPAPWPAFPDAPLVVSLRCETEGTPFLQRLFERANGERRLYVYRNWRTDPAHLGAGRPVLAHGVTA